MARRGDLAVSRALTARLLCFARNDCAVVDFFSSLLVISARNQKTSLFCGTRRPQARLPTLTAIYKKNTLTYRLPVMIFSIRGNSADLRLRSM